MRFVFFDEVKFNPPRQMAHRFGAISIPAESIGRIEEEIGAVAEKFFGTAEMRRDTEFHAVDMIQGAAHFKKRDIAERIEALCRLYEIANDEDIRRIEVSVLPERMVSTSPVADMAFMFLVEKCDHDLRKARSQGILVGDRDNEYADDGVLNLSRYRLKGTPYAFGKEIKNIVGGVHFIHSHHSRLVQLSDAYAYYLQLRDTNAEEDNYPKKKVRQFISEKTNLGYASSYKNWPTGDSWIRPASAAAQKPAAGK